MIVLDAGVFHQCERHPERLIALFQSLDDEEFVTNEAVMAQVWRSPARQVLVTRLISAFDITVEPSLDGKSIGILLGATDTTDVVDASVALLSRSNQAVVYTTDPDDLRHLGAEVVAI
jgi:hypothetical protein